MLNLLIQLEELVEQDLDDPLNISMTFIEDNLNLLGIYLPYNLAVLAEELNNATELDQDMMILSKFVNIVCCKFEVDNTLPLVIIDINIRDGALVFKVE